MSRLSRSMVALVCVMITSPAFGQSSQLTTTARDRQSVNVTVYNSNIGLVRETRRLMLPAGHVALRFADVAAQIMPQTVRFGSLSSANSLSILEQNYQYDLLNPAKLLEKYVGREVTLVLRRYENQTEILRPVEALLLSNNGGQVWKIENQIVINPSNIAEIRFPELPENLVATPTLVWDLDNRNNVSQLVEASYLTSGMNWQADYVLLVNPDDTRGDIQGWVTLTNTSGVGFKDANLQLVAGDVNRVKDGRDYNMMREMAAKVADEVGSAFQEQAFFEYHLYTLQRPATIREQETKQVSLLEAAGFNVAKEFVINGQHYYYTGYNSPGASIKEKVGVYMQFRNSQQNKLGMPLPLELLWLPLWALIAPLLAADAIRGGHQQGQAAKPRHREPTVKSFLSDRRIGHAPQSIVGELLKAALDQMVGHQLADHPAVDAHPRHRCLGECRRNVDDRQQEILGATGFGGCVERGNDAIAAPALQVEHRQR